MDEGKVVLIAFHIGVQLAQGNAEMDSIQTCEDVNALMRGVGMGFIKTTPEEVEHVAELLAPLLKKIG